MRLLSISILLCFGACFAQDDINLHFKNGIDYEYEYFVSLSTNEDKIDRPSEVNYTTKFIIKFFGNEGVLKINNVEVSDNTQNVKIDATKNHFTDYYLRFNMTSDGIIQWLLPDKREQHWVLNFKRGILSLFHTHLSHSGFNIDLHGVCFTDYKINKSEKERYIRREKQLMKCSGANKKERFARSFFMDEEMFKHIRYNEDGKQICNYTLLDEVYTKITCEEIFTLETDVKQASNIIFQNVKLIASTTKDIVDLDKYLSIVSFNSNKSYTDLAYYMPDVMRPLNDQKLYEDSKLQIDEICKNPNEFVGHNNILNFFEAVKPLNFQELSELEKYSNLCENSRKLFIDVLPYLPNQLISRNLMLQILAEQKIPKISEEEWLIILSFTKNIDYETLKYAYKLISKSPSPNAILTVGNLIKNYCDQFRTRDECYYDIEQILNVYKKSIATHFKESPEKAAELLYLYLAGFHNTEERHVTISETLVDILHDEYMPDYVRKQVADVLINKLSKPEKEYLLKFLNKNNESVEFRISLFQKLMKLLPNQVVQMAKDNFINEKPSQVTYFIFNYLCGGDFLTENANKLENLNTTFFKELCTPKNYSYDQFSHIYSANYIDSSVIFSPESFVPRNVRADMLQQKSSIDFTIHNIDKYVLSMFQDGEEKSSNNTVNAKTKRSNKQKKFDGPYVLLDLDLFGKKLKHYSVKGNNFEEELKKLGISVDDFMKIIHYDKGFTIQKSVIIANTENFRVTAAGFPMKRDLLFHYSLKLQIVGKLNDVFKEGNVHFNSSANMLRSSGIFTSNKIDTYYTKSSKQSRFSKYEKFPFKIRLDSTDFKNIKVTVKLEVDKWQYKMKPDHIVGSETHEIVPPKTDFECGYESLEIGNGFTNKMCYSYKNWRDVKKVVEKYGYCEYEMKHDLSEINNDPTSLIEWIKAEDKLYNLTFTHDFNYEKPYIKYHRANISKTNKNIEIKWLNDGYDLFYFQSDYENNDFNKYIRFKLTIEKEKQTIPKILNLLQRCVAYGSTIIPSAIMKQNKYML